MCIPNPGGTIFGSSDHPPTIFTKSNFINMIQVLQGRTDLFTSVCIPNPNRVILARCGDQFSIGTKGDEINPILMGKRAIDTLTRQHVPNLRITLLKRRIRTRSCKPFTVGVKLSVSHHAGMQQMFPSHFLAFPGKDLSLITAKDKEILTIGAKAG